MTRHEGAATPITARGAGAAAQPAAASNVVVVVAPFTPGVEAPHLGAAKKIELVLGLLHRLGFEVHLVDSSHPGLAFTSSVHRQPCHVGSTPLTLWRPACLPHRKLGKLLNVLTAPRFMRPLARLAPAFVWVYNSYSFEARAALFLKRHAAAKVVLELEDMPLARRRSFNPKPWLDQYFLPRLLAAADLVTYVNAALRRGAAGASQRSLLFPSLLQQALVDAPQRLRFGQATRRLGYFGGLDAEKGADVLLQAVPRLPAGWTLVVTGVGGLDAAFRAAQAAHPAQLEFHGRVSHERVLELMQGCDAIVNPHTPISQMNEGVFPFKVCEALASGALLVSTALPSIDIDLSRSMLPFDGSAAGLLTALDAAPGFYAAHAPALADTRNAICARYSEAAVLGQLRAELNVMLAAA